MKSWDNFLHKVGWQCTLRPFLHCETLKVILLILLLRAASHELWSGIDLSTNRSCQSDNQPNNELELCTSYTKNCLLHWVSSKGSFKVFFFVCFFNKETIFGNYFLLRWFPLCTRNRVTIVVYYVINCFFNLIYVQNDCVWFILCIASLQGISWVELNWIL